MSAKFSPRYQFVPHNDGAFFFVTDNGRSYTVELNNTHKRFDGYQLLVNGGQSFEIAFTCTTDVDATQEDAVSVSNTILHILTTNIQARGTFAVYFFICDISQGLGKARARLFERWHRLIRTKIPSLEKYNFKVPGFDGEQFNVSLLIYTEHPDREQYIQQFEAILAAEFAKGSDNNTEPN